MELLTRAGFRSQVTKIINESSEYLNSSESAITDDTTKLETIEEELSVFLQRLSTANENLRGINLDISAKKIEDKNPEKIAEYDDVATGGIARLQIRLSKVKSRLNPCGNLNESAAAPIPVVKGTSNIKLPILPLKTFSGDYQDWIPFWENFRTAVHENNALRGSDKFNYLQSVLSGNAQKAIAGFTPSDACYDGAISLLQEEYGDTEKLIDKNMQQLMSLPKVHQRTDSVGLRQLYNTVVSSSRSLTSLGVPSSHYYIMLKTVLLKCMPTDLRIDYHRIKKEPLVSMEAGDGDAIERRDDSSSESGSTYLFDGDKEVKNILRFLKQEVESIERASVGKVHRLSTQHMQPSTAAGLFTSSYNAQCFFCKASNHQTKECSDCSTTTLEDRKNLLKRDGRCFRCTSRGHMAKMCHVKGLVCNKCNGKHATVICNRETNEMESSENGTSLNTNANTNQAIESNHAATMLAPNEDKSNSSIVFLQTARILIAAPLANGHLFARIIIDGGSQRSYVKESVVSKLKLQEVGVLNLNVIPFGQGKLSNFKEFKVVRVHIRSQFTGRSIDIEALVVPEICIDVLPVPCSANYRFYDEEICLADSNPYGHEQENGLSVLIGADYYWKVSSGRYKKLTSSLTAVETMFGWTIQGPSETAETSSPFNKNMSSLCSFTVLENMWKLESIGIKSDDLEKSFHTNNLQDKYIRKTNTRYEASLPWRDASNVLEDNRSVAICRLRSLHKKLSRDPTKFFEYDRLMREFIAAGSAEPAKEYSSTRTYYMPHRPVYRPDKSTTKVRIVFDASSHEEGKPSLNDCLLTGSNLLPDILNILLKFRTGMIGMMADIEKAFLQIELAENDRDVHRFLWYSEPVQSVSRLPTIKEYRMTRVTFGVTCSPFLLPATIHLHLANETSYFPETCSLLRQSFYVDDLVTSMQDNLKAKCFHHESTVIMNKAFMNLRKWVSNDEIIRQHFGEDTLSGEQTVLGVRWNIHSDDLSVNIKNNEFQDVDLPTKRNVLKVIARIYDPLGYLGPIVIRMKILFQSLWRMKLDWDEPLKEDLSKEWRSCIKDLHKLGELSVPRWLGTSDGAISRQVHIFSDASMKAFGIVAYVRVEDSRGTVTIRFLCAKSRVAPLKEEKSNDLSLPRLELTAALLAARLCSYLQKIQMPIDEYYLWTDSKITLYWVQSDSRKWKPYIFNRVKEVQELTNPTDWRHCPGQDNPADLVTRGISIDKFCSSASWNDGPTWLKRNKEEWIGVKQQLSDCSTVVLAAFEEGEEIHTKCELEPLLPYQSISSWRRLLRITAYVMRAVTVFSTRKSPATKFLKTVDIQKAEHYWLRYFQNVHFSNEIFSLRQGKPIARSSTLLTLNPFLDEDGLIRVNSRLQQLDEPQDIITPILLPKSAFITQLIAVYLHELTLHSGVNTVLSALREKFWLPSARQIIKKVIKGCRVCKRLRSKPCSMAFAPLPRERLIAARPFETVGVDFAGPMYTSHDEEKMKVYIMIFTCAVVRAIHLELVPNLTTESCLLAIRRFIARRGIPKFIYSDNAKTFKKAASELVHVGSIIESEAFDGFLSNSGITWRFSVERAPWWGGFWERLIKSVKDILKISIWKAKLNYEELETFLTEAERIVNSRPLTYISDDPLDLTPITPMSFFVGKFSLMSQESALEISQEGLRAGWKTRKQHISLLWKRFKSEYLHLLRSAHHTDKVISKTVQQGDIVMVYNPATPRIHWRLAIVETCYPGRDNQVRACEVRFADGKRMRRAIQLLYPLEVGTKGGAEDVKN